MLAEVLGAAALSLLCPGARADDCRPLAEAKAAFGAGDLAKLNQDQAMFARGLFVASPPVSPYPPGEDVLFGPRADGGVVFFVHGDKSCGELGLSPDVAKSLVDLGKTI